MICENCGTQKASRVLDSRERNKFTYRRRKCSICGFEYVTHEVFIRGSMPIDGPRVIPYEALKEWKEAVWIENNGTTKMIATSIADYHSTAVTFANGYLGRKANYNQYWRVWSARPTEKQRAGNAWAEYTH